jgi:hypothetical protein
MVQYKPHSLETCFEYQYSETNVMYFLFSLLRMKDLYMFRALLAHPQEVLHKRHLVYCLRVISVLVQPADNTHAVHQVTFLEYLLRINK